MSDDKYVVYENKRNGTRFYTSFNESCNYEDNEYHSIVETNVSWMTANLLCKETVEKTIEVVLDETPKELRSPRMDKFIADMIRMGQ